MVGWYKFKLIFVSLGLLSILVGLFPVVSTAGALSGSSFKAGRIIDDQVFYDWGSLSASAIQSFLELKVPHCDTYGREQSEYGSGTRADYGRSRGYPPPYICLKNYKRTVSSKAADAYCPGSVSSSGTNKRTAAQIIAAVAKACHVSPKSLIVTLQKEQALVTDEWPFPTQYKKAMGYGCPDSAPCDSEFAGFVKQLYWAAHQFRRYRALPNNYNYVAGQNNTILWNPSSSCGSSEVYISTQATAGLYNYTPYRPNAAALANLNGSGNSCSAYGNRNFWRDYNNWFGSTLTTPVKVKVVDNATSESGGTARLQFSLVTRPTATVTIPLSLTDTSEATITSGSNLTITRSNWDKPGNNVATITGDDDGYQDGDIHYSLKTGNPASNDPTYDNLSSADVRNVLIVNTDNESDVPLGGDFNGDKRGDAGLKRGNEYLLNYNHDNSANVRFKYGQWTDTALIGDWDGDGKDEIGYKRGNDYYLNYGNDGVSNVHFSFGSTGDTPIVGDWDGDGKDEIGIKHGRTYKLNYGNDSRADKTFIFGQASDTPLAGNWDKDKRDEVGYKRGHDYRLNYGYDDTSEVRFQYGRTSDVPVVADWDKDGKDEIGLNRGSTFYLNYGYDSQSETSFSYGR